MLGHLVPSPPNLDHCLNFHLNSCLFIPTPTPHSVMQLLVSLPIYRQEN